MWRLVDIIQYAIGTNKSQTSKSSSSLSIHHSWINRSVRYQHINNTKNSMTTTALKWASIMAQSMYLLCVFAPRCYLIGNKTLLSSSRTKSIIIQIAKVRIPLTTGESGSKQVQTFPWDSLWKLYTVYKS